MAQSFAAGWWKLKLEAGIHLVSQKSDKVKTFVSQLFENEDFFKSEVKDPNE